MKTLLTVGVCMAAAGLAEVCRAQATLLTTQRVASGLSSPIFATSAPNDPRRLFIVEQGTTGTGVIKILDLPTGVVRAVPFLQVPGLNLGGERGLLGLAFHPQYATNGYFYVNYTTAGGGAAGKTVVARYRVSANPDVADAASASMVININQPADNHNGGWLGFGPDGYLYVAMGDGGNGNDPDNHAQTLTNDLLGKMLRLDVNGDDFPADSVRNYRIPPTNPFVGKVGDDEIWAYGLRNPWRNSFDRATGDLWIADVGQAQFEEIDFQPASSPGGANYGWRCMEGNVCRALAGCNCPTPLGVPPIYAYFHDLGCSVSGGYVYRGCAIPDLRGTYFFSDYCTSKIWTFRYSSAVSEFADRTAELAPGGGLSIASVSSFGEDFYGELYVIDRGGGEVFKIVPRTFAGLDCNSNGIADACDIAGGFSADANHNGVPDECGCLADLNGDGFVDGLDSDQFNNAFEAGAMSSDLNGDGFVDGLDSDLFNNHFELGC